MSKRVAGTPASATQTPTAPAPVPDRKERLRRALPAAVELLRTRQASLIAVDDLDAFVELNWLEWHGGSLRLTVTGSNVCSQCRAAAAAAAAAAAR